MVWLNLTIPNQTVKNGLKATKIKLPEMNFFLEKQLIKFSCNYWPLSFCKILKNFFGSIQSYEMCHFRAQNGPFVMEKKFLYKPLLLLSFTFCPSSLCKILKKNLQWIQSYEDAPFLGPKWSICSKQIFFGKLLESFSSTYWSLLFWGSAIFGPKIAHFPKWEFFSENLLMSLVSFIHAYLHTKNQSQVLIY